MTQSEWLASTDPQRMLRRLTHERVHAAGVGTTEVPRENSPATDRKLRLFACACCRSVWPQLTDERSRHAVEVAERYADGEAMNEELYSAAKHAALVSDLSTFPAAWDASFTCSWRAMKCVEEVVGSPQACQPATQAALLRCIFGNPFRPVTFPCTRCWGQGEECWKCKGIGKQQEFPAYLKVWNGGTVPKIAASIYGGRLFDEMPILADALEEAGCDNEDVLMHCRGRERCGKCYGKGYLKTPGSVWGPTMPCKDVATDLYPSGIGCDGTGWRPLGCGHVRGCWALDLLLGKE